MIAGHIGAAAAAKSFDHRVPFWALLVASFLIDILFAVLWAAGVEKIEAMPGTDGGYGEMLFQVDWSHSFFGAIALSFLALVFMARAWGGKGALLISGVVFSHWFLDMIVHRNDLPIVPGNAAVLPRVGLGLWDAPIAAAILEALIVIGGAYLWYRSRPQPAPEDDTPRGQHTTRAAALALAGGLLALAIDFSL